MALPTREQLIPEVGGPLPRLAFSLDEVGEILGLSRHSIDALVRDRRLRPLDLGGSRSIRISLLELQRFCEEAVAA